MAVDDPVSVAWRDVFKTLFTLSLGEVVTTTTRLAVVRAAMEVATSIDEMAWMQGAAVVPKGPPVAFGIIVQQLAIRDAAGVCLFYEVRDEAGNLHRLHAFEVMPYSHALDFYNKRVRDTADLAHDAAAEVKAKKALEPPLSAQGLAERIRKVSALMIRRLDHRSGGPGDQDAHLNEASALEVKDLRRVIGSDTITAADKWWHNRAQNRAISEVAAALEELAMLIGGEP